MFSCLFFMIYIVDRKEASHSPQLKGNLAEFELGLYFSSVCQE